ncbi:transmembrane protein FT27 [Synechocystis sp. PCC 6803]|uniref:GDT1-like protein sll0615 n=1 Tax=Synechocystis sp. (strain ATCC 27184 / PCC 6803 / Kazusa) TaxID=1111708 RepID=Y615_SYNY3|nr:MULTISPECIES: TMEM165/GDT1 family protein [unclassified Synechocystis]P52876.1 RecName: Full=GDT1-like protein sll0615 [Synechocystis sp. PCC 6803 substr. Kazusa]BAM54063.1 hypothetical protein BEST7613_5132 [Synechocystis sp. PCC 6803] [Bacillus subtilis BEST7613]AAA96398.1 similar to Mus musculus transmembrane protein (clone pFT27); Method: conceptual translation supplied by author; ORF206 [Synechocystis sp. PCC 6803]AGF52640.1 transmembrane protein FT27 [Synechocystis sp. PCC 6803]ALJ685
MLTAFTAGLLLITVSELGDKTFFIAMILAMRYPRRWVLVGVVGGLAAMTILSVLMGQIFTFLPTRYINYAEVALFLIFGTKLLWDARRIKATANLEEMEDAEKAIASGEKKLKIVPRGWGIVVESFALTFVAEWGDRTQIATIALAASNNAWGVSAGAILGHTICAVIAVMGGKFVAGRISEKTVTLIGGLLFYLFAVVSWWTKIA